MISDLVDWSKREFSHLPWRRQKSLYRTLVSEIMLQQTTVATVLNRFEDFISLYPTIDDLAATTEEEVCIAWKGLGYYRRARNLRKAAIDIVFNHEGKIPLDRETLISIAGIGEYTADAILGIGNKEWTLALDANIERVTSRLFGIKELKGPKLHKAIREKFLQDKLYKKEKNLNGQILNEALMDLGRVYCQARSAFCEQCPMNDSCWAKKNNSQLTLPTAPAKTNTNFHDLKLLRIIVKSRGKVLAYQKSEAQWLTGQWELPTFVLSTEDSKFSQYPNYNGKKIIDLASLPKVKTSITKYKIENYILEASVGDLKQFGIDPKKYYYRKIDLEKENFSTATIKSLKKVL